MDAAVVLVDGDSDLNEGMLPDYMYLMARRSSLCSLQATAVPVYDDGILYFELTRGLAALKLGALIFE